MLPFRRTFESEKQQLQQLNSRLAQYLCRTKQLEQENAHLVTEINKLRQGRTTTAELEPKYKAEMRDLRRMVEQLSLEKSQVEVEREKLWRELQLTQCLSSEQTEVCRDISGELKGCEKELHDAHRTNTELQQRLLQLESEYGAMEEAHRQEMERARRKVESRVVPIISQTYRGPPVVPVEELQEYARCLSEGWVETFEMYQQKVEEMEQAMKADQAMLSELQREKMLYAAQMDKLRTESEKQGRLQVRLEDELMNMQENFRVDLSNYQMIIQQLEQERNLMANTIAEKMQEHQHLLQIKMNLGMEVAAYRALLEGERVSLEDTHRRVNQHQRERIIDIKMPAQPYTVRTSMLTTRQHKDVQYTQPRSSLTRSPMAPSSSRSPPRVIPISVVDRARYQSPPSRRDMISFSKARAAASAPVTTIISTTAVASASAKDEQTGKYETHMSPCVQKTSEERSVKIKEVSREESQISHIKSPTRGGEAKSVRVVSPPMMSLSTKSETESQKQLMDKMEREHDYDRKFEEEEGKTESTSVQKISDSLSVEEIIEKVIKPAGSEAQVCSSGESKVRYDVEKSEKENGTTTTQIVLESKVEEEVDVGEESVARELLSVKKVSLEDIEDTATGSIIKNLLSNLQAADNLQNKSVSVEITEEPVDSHINNEGEIEEMSRSTYHEPFSTYFQIEELENEAYVNDATKSFMTDADPSRDESVHVEDISSHSESPYFSHDQESHEYFVSTPDNNLSESEEGGGITSYGHYGMVDDLSDEKYYQDENIPLNTASQEEGNEYKFLSDLKEGFPECIIEEEVCVSPVVQESVLEFLREDSLEPKEQLKGALEKLQSSVSGPLKEELAFLTKISSESPQNVAVNVTKVQQSSDNGTMTIVAELNVSQTLEDSGLLDAEHDLSEEQIMAALRSSNLEKGFQIGPGGGYSSSIDKTEDIVHGEEFEGFADQGESVSEITEKYVKHGPSEKSFTFQMGSHSEASSEQELKSQISVSPVRISQEKRVATIYLDSPED